MSGAQSSSTISDIKSEVGFSARVVPEGMTRLFTRDGVESWVPSEHVPRFLAEGYAAELIDGAAAARELLAHARALPGAIEAVLHDFEQDGEAYASNALVAYESVQAVANGWAKLSTVLATNPEPQPGVKMKPVGEQAIHESDDESVVPPNVIEVDPGQVALYESKGYERVAG